jgi:hypothetical protein
MTVEPPDSQAKATELELGLAKTQASAVTCRAANVLLSMCVTACSSERNWSKWGLLFVPHRNALGLERAQRLVFAQQNDLSTRAVRSMDTVVE